MDYENKYENAKENFIDEEKEYETIKVYAPLMPCKHHVSSSKIHPYFGKHQESIVSKKITILIKVIGLSLLSFIYITFVLPKFEITTESEKMGSYIVPIFLIGFTLYQIIHLFHRVDLFETGMVYKTLYASKEYKYDELYDIQFTYDEQFYLDERRHGFIWYIFAKRFYRYYKVTVTSGKGFILRPRTFRNLDIKITDLQNNLIKVKKEK